MRSRFVAVCAAGVVAIVMLFSAASALAHPQFAIATVNRYGKLVLVGRGEPRLFYALMVGDVPALRLRKSADRDGNGTLDAAEQAELGAQLQAQLATSIKLYEGEKPLALRWSAPTLGLQDPAVTAAPFSLDAAATVPATTESGRELRYEDRVDLSPPGEVELQIEEAPDVRLKKTAGPGDNTPSTAGTPVRMYKTYGGTTVAARALVVALSYESTRAKPAREARGPLALYIGGGIGVLLAAALLVRRRRAAITAGRTGR